MDDGISPWAASGPCTYSPQSTEAPPCWPAPPQALVDLYFFKEANPGQDIEAMLSSASATFKNFIMWGLHKV